MRVAPWLRGPLLYALGVALAWAMACSSTSDSTFKAAEPDGSTGDDSGSSSGGPMCVSDAGPPSATDFAGQPDCPAHTCTLSGTLAGQPVMKSYPRTMSFNFYAGGSGTGEFDAFFGTSGQVHLEFMGPVSAGQVIASTGASKVTMPMEGPMAGATICLGDGSRVEEVSPGEVRFLLRCMSSPCGLGTGAPIDGQMYGCCAN